MRLLGGVGCQWELGSSGGVGDVRGVLGTGRKCRYSGARRGICGINGHWGL